MVVQPKIQMTEQGRILSARRAPACLFKDLSSFSLAERFRPGEILQYLVSRAPNNNTNIYASAVRKNQVIGKTMPREEKAEEVGETNTSASSSQKTSIKIFSMEKYKREEARQATSSERKSQMENKENSEINSKNMKKKPN
ncbi:hypothetical protein CHS0354_013728 [Potamilus streckersoni]|uniref:Uncharacterized protein n=1 Tax=Potamilus streckersoni TaxID=2493646 RepID=A0AAE0SAU2_9BIVA|nr:hypothetical protein CHS0354_013728 [Potamilus streckersoni]